MTPTQPDPIVRIARCCTCGHRGTYTLHRGDILRPLWFQACDCTPGRPQAHIDDGRLDDASDELRAEVTR